MGEVILVIRVLPDSIESIGDVENALKAMMPARFEEEPIAFGMKSFKVTFIVPDGGGNVQEDLENKLESIKGVSSIEVLMASRGM